MATNSARRKKVIEPSTGRVFAIELVLMIALMTLGTLIILYATGTNTGFVYGNV